MGITTGTFDLIEIYQLWPSLTLDGLQRILPFGLSLGTVKTIAFWAFVVAFAVKVPIWPVHTWLPDAHTEAPTAGSMILAGVLLKLGAYGFIRLVIPLFPQAGTTVCRYFSNIGNRSHYFWCPICFWSKGFKEVGCICSINHMGFVVSRDSSDGLCLGTSAEVRYTIRNIAMNGSILQMFNHGLSSAGMFFLVGVIYDRAHTRQLDELGGLWAILPKYGSIFVFMSMASLGLPGLNGFVSEFLIVRGAWGYLPTGNGSGHDGFVFYRSLYLKGNRGAFTWSA